MSVLVHDLHVLLGGAPVVRGVSFEVRRQEVVGLMGPAGCGARATLSALTGQVPLAHGTAASSDPQLPLGRPGSPLRVVSPNLAADLPNASGGLHLLDLTHADPARLPAEDLAQWAQRRTLVLATRSREYAGLCHRALLLHQGTLVAEVPGPSLLASPLRYIVGFAANKSVTLPQQIGKALREHVMVDTVEPLTGELEWPARFEIRAATDPCPSLCSWAVSEGLAINELIPVHSPLEALLLRLPPPPR